MIWTEATIKRIQPIFPNPRGSVDIDYLTFFQALQYIAEHGCRWRVLPEPFGKWYTLYQRFRRWIHLGVFDRIEKEPQADAIAIKGMKTLAIDSTYVKVHPDGTGTSKKKDRNPSATIETYRVHVFSLDSCLRRNDGLWNRSIQD
jgi:transposase